MTTWWESWDKDELAAEIERLQRERDTNARTVRVIDRERVRLRSVLESIEMATEPGALYASVAVHNTAKQARLSAADTATHPMCQCEHRYERHLTPGMECSHVECLCSHYRPTEHADQT